MISLSACLQRSATDLLGPPVSARPAASYTIPWDTTNPSEGLDHIFLTFGAFRCFFKGLGIQSGPWRGWLF